ncbi:HP domain-containing protein, partial [Haematococcus lacustris]
GLPSPHDARNTINAAQLLKQKAFKFQPLKDWFPVEELVKLRLEDGIDPTCKEDYLEDSVFKEVS